MAKKGNISLSKLAKQASRIKVTKKLDSMEDAPFFKKKMKKGSKILSISDLPNK